MFRQQFPDGRTARQAFRGAHPALRPADFFKGVDSNGNGLIDITWLQNTGQEADTGYMTNPNNQFLAAASTVRKSRARAPPRFM